MDNLDSMAERISWARKAAGYDGFADAGRALGIHPSTYRSYEVGDRTPKPPAIEKIARRFGISHFWLVTGRGAPTRGAVAETAGAPSETAMVATEPPDQTITRQDVPLCGTARGGGAGGFRLSDTPVRTVWRSPALAGERDVYALYVDGDSMTPAFPPGTLVFVAPSRPCRVGDTVIVTQQAHESALPETYIKTFAARDGARLVFRQFLNNAKTVMTRDTVVTMHRVLTTSEVFGV